MEPQSNPIVKRSIYYKQDQIGQNQNAPFYNWTFVH